MGVYPCFIGMVCVLRHIDFRFGVAKRQCLNFILDDATAIVTSKYKTLVVLDISGGQLSISRTVEIDYDIRGISSCKNKLVVRRVSVLIRLP